MAILEMPATRRRQAAVKVPLHLLIFWITAAYQAITSGGATHTTLARRSPGMVARVDGDDKSLEEWTNVVAVLVIGDTLVVLIGDQSTIDPLGLSNPTQAPWEWPDGPDDDLDDSGDPMRLRSAWEFGSTSTDRAEGWWSCNGRCSQCPLRR